MFVWSVTLLLLTILDRSFYTHNMLLPLPEPCSALTGSYTEGLVAQNNIIYGVSERSMMRIDPTLIESNYRSEVDRPVD